MFKCVTTKRKTLKCRVLNQAIRHFVAGTALLVAPAVAVPIEDVYVGIAIPTSITEEATLTGEVLRPIEVTGSHRIDCLSRDQWIMAGELRPGEAMLSADGEAVVSMLPRPGGEPAWSLEVHRGHSYFVGDQRVLVHNHPPAAPSNRHGGGRHAKHASLARRQQAAADLNEAKKKLAELKTSGASKVAERKQNELIKHFQAKQYFTGEHYSKHGPKGNR